jgi:hypothetical protein
VQPQKRKKKHSMETKATDSNAEISAHATSSTIHEKLMSKPRVAHLGARYEETKLGHLETDDRPSEITHSRSNHRNADVAHDISLPLWIFFFLDFF